MQLPPFPRKNEISESSNFTSGGHLPAKVLPALQDCNMDTLLDETKRIFYRNNCDCVPLFENQFGAYQACDDLGNLWGFKTSASLPDSTITLASLPKTQAQLLRRHLANLSSLEFTTTTLKTISITITRTFGPEQLFKRQSKRF